MIYLVSTMFSSVSAQESKWSLLYGDDDHPLAIWCGWQPSRRGAESCSRMQRNGSWISWVRTIWLRIQQWPHDFLLCKSGAQFVKSRCHLLRDPAKILFQAWKGFRISTACWSRSSFDHATPIHKPRCKRPAGSSNMTRLRQWEHEARWNPTHHYSIDW